MDEGGMSGDLAWWREHGRSADPVALRDVLARLKTWKAQHDVDRAAQPGPFLKLAWDAVFGDEDEQVSDAIQQIEERLGA